MQNEMLTSQDGASFEVASDGTTVWVNDDQGTNVGRFSKNGIDIHHNLADQERLGKQCFDCKAGPCGIDDWAHFVAMIWVRNAVRVDNKHRPTAIDGQPRAVIIAEGQ